MILLALPLLYGRHAIAQETVLHKIHIPPQPLLTERYQEVKSANLSIADVRSIYQSSDGTVWISTQNEGLIAYHGNSLKHYRHDPKNNNSLPGNHVLETWEESPHLLWITMVDCLVKFNRLTARFTRFPANSRYVCKTPDGTLYTTVQGKGLYRIDTLRHTIHPAGEQTLVSTNGTLFPHEKMAFISQMVADNEGTIWIAGKSTSLEGLFRFDKKNNRWIWHAPSSFYHTTTANPMQVYKTANVQAISATSLLLDGDKIWLGGFAQGLLCYEKKSNRWDQFYFYRNQQAYYDDNSILALAVRKKNELWISAAANSFVFNAAQATVSNFSFLRGQGAAPGFRDGTLFPLTDHSGNQWLAGSFGVFKYHPQQDYFSAAKKARLPFKNTQLITAVTALAPDRYLVGIGNLEAPNAEAKSEIQEIAMGRQKHRVLINETKDRFFPQQFLQAGKNTFYLCAELLHRLDLQKQNLQTIRVLVKNEPTYLHQDYYHNILWNDSILYSCRRTSANAGLVKINLRTGDAWLYKNDQALPTEKSPQDNAIVRLMRDSYNRIWCRTAGGLDIFYPDKEIFEHYYPIDGDTTSIPGSALSFCEGLDRTFYITTHAGVVATKAVPGTKARFEHLADVDGFGSWPIKATRFGQARKKAWPALTLQPKYISFTVIKTVTAGIRCANPTFSLPDFS